MRSRLQSDGAAPRFRRALPAALALVAVACGGGLAAPDAPAPIALPVPSFHHVHVNSIDPDPDGILGEFNGTAETTELFHGHTHLWHEQPLCAANWYVEHLGLTLPPLRDPETGAEAPRPPYDPCDVEIGDVSYPTFLPMGQLRSPIGNVRLANAGWAWYSRQCRDGRCGPELDRRLARSRGQVVDHVAVSYPDLDPVLARLAAAGIPLLDGPYAFGDTRAVLIEDLDGLAIELTEAGS